jgi:hypothetical protein
MANASPPDAGRVITPKNCRIGYVEQIIEENELDCELLAWVQSALPDWGNFWQEWDKAHRENDEQTLNRLMAKQHELEAQFGYNPEQKAQTVLSGLGFAKNKWTLSLRKLSGGWQNLPVCLWRVRMCFFLTNRQTIWIWTLLNGWKNFYFLSRVLLFLLPTTAFLWTTSAPMCFIWELPSLFYAKPLFRNFLKCRKKLKNSGNGKQKNLPKI